MSKCECRDCIHYEVCKKISAVLGLAFGKSPFCNHFKDKSLFVELPCKVGDKVYCINDIDTQIEECEIVGFGFNKVHKEVFMLDKDGAEYYANEFGKYYFFDRAEAERKLKEDEE